MSALAVLGCTIQITTSQVASSIQIKTSPSDKIIVNQKGVYFGDIDVQLTDIKTGNLVCPSGTITISGTADNVLELNGESKEKAVQVGDSGNDTFEFTDTSTGQHTPLPVGIMVVDAGQSDVSAT